MPSIDQSSVDLCALVGSVAKAGKTRGRRSWFCAPWREESTPSLSVDKERGVWWDFGEHCGGDAISFVARLRGLDPSKGADMREILAELALETDPQTLAEWRAERAAATKRAELATGARERFDGSHAARFARDKYGLSVETMARYGLGVGTKAQAAEYELPVAGRLCIPYTSAGRVTAFAWRSVDGSDPKMLATSTAHGRRGIFGLQQAEDRPDPVVIVEGEGDAMACDDEGLAAVAICSTKPSQEDALVLVELKRPLVVLLDGDAPGEAAAPKLAEHLARLGADVSLAVCPRGQDGAANDPAAQHKATPGSVRPLIELARPAAMVLVDMIATNERADRLGDRLAELAKLIAKRGELERDQWIDYVCERFKALKRARVEDIVRTASRRKSDRPELILSGDLHTRTRTVMDALERSDWTYQRGGRLVVVDRGSDGAASIGELDKLRLRAELCARFAFASQKMGRAGFVIESVDAPPIPLLENIIETRHTSRPLEIVSRAPVYSPDWVLRLGGYSKECATFVDAPGLQLPPIDSSQEGVARAVELIDEVLFDFKLDAPSRANAFALFLAPFVRLALWPANCPLWLIAAPRAGSGKGLIVDCVSAVATGKEPFKLTEAGQAGDDEWRKKIGAALSQHRAIILLDNVNAELAGGSLASALTSSTWSDRLLGKNDRTISYRNAAVWAATANNPCVSGEIGRRTLLIRIVPQCEDPSERSAASFKIPRLVRHCLDHRAELIAAAATIVENWIANDKQTGTVAMGSFEETIGVLGGMLECAGIAGLHGNRNAVREISDEGDNWAALVAAFATAYEGQSLSAATWAAKAAEAGMLTDVLGPGNERSQATRMGRALAKQVDRVYAGFRLARAQVREGWAYRWVRV